MVKVVVRDGSRGCGGEGGGEGGGSGGVWGMTDLKLFFVQVIKHRWIDGLR